MKIERDFASLLGTRKILAALVAVAVILGVQLLQSIASTILNLGFFLGQDSGGMSQLSSLLWTIALGVVPFSVGVFLCLWLVAPIAAELRVMGVLGRSLIAAGAGAIVLFVAVLLGSLLSNFDESAGLVFGWAYGAMATAASNIGWVSLHAMYSAANMAITVAPLTVLAGVLVWLWLRAHPVDAPKTGGTGEV